jgi:FtsP/CotA-like multicopper oxidase with cupredoxin domain
MNRRQFLATSAAALAASSVPRLAIAQTAPRQFDLTAGRIDKALYPEGGNSSLWAYNSTVPGPEIRVAKGDRIKVNFRNELEEPTSIHWHGIRIANAMDGVSDLTQEPVQPGEEFVYEFDVPDAGTYWYHAHNKSWNQVGRGLYGPLIIDEPEPPFDAAHDLTLVIDDWRLAAPGVLDEESFGSMMDWSHGGRLGNWVTVNGEAGPSFKLQAGEAYRMRLVNAANARVLEFDLNSFGAKVLAYDGQALPEALTLEYSPFMLGPSQRVDLLIVPEEDFTLDALFDEDPFPLAEFQVAGEVNAAVAIPALPMNDLPEPDLANARRVQVVMEGGAMGGFVDITYKGEKLEGEAFPRTKQSWAFNGVANLAEDPLFAAKAGETIIIETVNKTAWVHAMHIHGHHFRVLSRSSAGVDEGQPWRDTFLIGGEQTAEIAFVADNPGRWLYHCHMLEHAAAGMNTWFNIT